MIGSLRARLVLGTTFATLIVYTLAALLLYGLIRLSLLAEFDQALSAKAHALVALIETTDHGVKLDVEPNQFGPPEPGDGFILRNADGTPLAHSESFNTPTLPALASQPLGHETFGFARTPGHHPVRFVTLQFVPKSEDEDHAAPALTTPLTLLVTRNAQTLDHKLHQLAWLLAGVFALTTLITAAIMVGVIRQGLRPLGILAQRIAGLAETDLATRINLSDAPQEMQPVVQRLNELLARLEASFARERSFTADVAHELRTPLAGLTTALQVCASQPRAPEDYQRVMAQCLKVSNSMRLMVENLLTLARADARQLRPVSQPIHLETLLKDTWSEYAPRAAAKHLEISWSLAPETSLSTDPGLLTVVLRNLFDNALTYANDAGSVHVETRSDAHGLALRISNTGSLVDVQDAPKVFDRFWRSDAARTPSGDHCGLGLALCQRIALLLGGTIDATTITSGLFTITLRFPPTLSPPPQATSSQ